MFCLISSRLFPHLYASMKNQYLPQVSSALELTKGRVVCSHRLLHVSRDVNNLKQQKDEFISRLLERRWLLLNPEPKIQRIMVSKRPEHCDGLLSNYMYCSCSFSAYNLLETNYGYPFFDVVRDDLLHPLINGNKSRKLDGLLPLLDDNAITDVVTCGGCQSAHAAAVGVLCAERGLRSHLLLRGEQPKILTGYNLISTIYGNVSYVSRSLYANRKEMLSKHASMVAGSSGCVVSSSNIPEATSQKFSKRVATINDGAGDVVGLLGIIRLVHYLSLDHNLGKQSPVKLVVDAGTGTTAVGLGLGALCLGLPWEVVAVMLADTIDGYKKQEKRLISDFKIHYASDPYVRDLITLDSGVVHWVERHHPRKFGNIMDGELNICQTIARQSGILVDPIYTLAAWEWATRLSEGEGENDSKVVMIHTGGTLALFGLAQRYKSYFHSLDTAFDAPHERR